jgi:1,4-dihydroxy-2-naphthoate octaprenyltransferase
MTALSTASERSSLSIWLQATRPFSFPASIIPVLVATVWTYVSYSGNINWYLFPVILFGAVLFHMGTNLISDYFDYQKGVDKQDTFGSSRVIVEGLLKPKQVLFGGLLTFAIGFLLGLILVAHYGLPILYLGIAGLIGGIFYTGYPINYKYIALGDLGVFMLFGPLLMLGTFMGLTGQFSWEIMFISLPLGLLVAAILNANNIRDILHDSSVRIKTMATILGIQGAKIEYYTLVIGAYSSVIIMFALGMISPWTLLVFLSLKPAIDNMKFVSSAKVDEPQLIVMSDVRTAQHQLLFGVLYALGMLIGKWF